MIIVNEGTVLFLVDNVKSQYSFFYTILKSYLMNFSTTKRLNNALRINHNRSC